MDIKIFVFISIGPTDTHVNKLQTMVMGLKDVLPTQTGYDYPLLSLDFD